MPRIRLAWIERRARSTGTIKRKDVVSAFGLSLAQASSDLQTLQLLAPGCLEYDLAAKCYRWAGGEAVVIDIPSPIRDFVVWESSDKK